MTAYLITVLGEGNGCNVSVEGKFLFAERLLKARGVEQCILQ